MTVVFSEKFVYFQKKLFLFYTFLAETIEKSDF